MRLIRCRTPRYVSSKCLCVSARAGSRSRYATLGRASHPICWLESSSRLSRPRHRARGLDSDWRFRRASSENSAVRSSPRTDRKEAPSSRSNSRQHWRLTMPDGIKVLLIEDDTAVRIGSEQALQLAGFPVESFESAERALVHIKPGMPTVIVSDVKLAGM